jgi:hypothetical protein
MSWSTPADLRAQVQHWWTSGDLLASAAGAGMPFPRRLRCKGPASGEMVDRFDEVRRWSAQLCGMPHVRIEMREFRHPVLGRNALPAIAWIDTLDDALAILGKKRDAERFVALYQATRMRQPLLLSWLQRQPLRALALEAQWPQLLDVAAWMQAHPRPGIYLRQVDIPGVHSKFIESQRAVLSELLDLALPAGAIAGQSRGAAGFAARYGFRDKPQRVRFRMLDPARRLLATAGEQDMTLDVDSFACLAPGVARVFITENEINYLAFPAVADSMMIFGAGYGFDMLAQADWLARRQVHYWGDIDTHGYAILDQLRTRFPHVESMLMDRATLMAFKAQWSTDDKPLVRDLPRLNAEESALYDALRDQQLGTNVRLEQELIAFGWVRQSLTALPGATLLDPPQ